ncbi:MAG: transcription elongation factor GreA [Metamycoplasmataceae bacterium]
MKSNEKVQITKQKLEELKKELRHLIDVERVKTIEEIKIARENGDLSENAEYEAAREKQGIIEDKISELENLIDHAEIISGVSSTINQVSLFSKVTFKNLSTNKSHSIQIVNTLEANPFENKISSSSPLGIAALHKSVGDVVEIEANPNYKIKIESINK